jgi:hypothetical protein
MYRNDEVRLRTVLAYFISFVELLIGQTIDTNDIQFIPFGFPTDVLSMESPYSSHYAVFPFSLLEGKMLQLYTQVAGR